jgi:hypothetical protein
MWLNIGILCCVYEFSMIIYLHDFCCVSCQDEVNAMKLKNEKEKYGFSGKMKAFISLGTFMVAAGIIALFAIHQVNQYAYAEEQIIAEQIQQAETVNAPNGDSDTSTNTGVTTRPPAPEAPAPPGSTSSGARTTRTCMAGGCSRPGTRSFVGIFSNQTEWYCQTHYNELQDMFDIFN